MNAPKRDRFSSHYHSLASGNDDNQESDIHLTKDTEAESTEKKREPSFLRALFHTIGYPFLVTGVYKLAYDLLTFVQPQLLG